MTLSISKTKRNVLRWKFTYDSINVTFFDPNVQGLIRRYRNRFWINFSAKIKWKIIKGYKIARIHRVQTSTECKGQVCNVLKNVLKRKSSLYTKKDSLERPWEECCFLFVPTKKRVPSKNFTCKIKFTYRAIFIPHRTIFSSSESVDGGPLKPLKPLHLQKSIPISIAFIIVLLSAI